MDNETTHNNMLHVICLLFLVITRAVHATCALSAADWQSIHAAYTNRNHYEVLGKPLCNSSLPTSFPYKYGNCAQTLQQVLTTQNLIPNGESCVDLFTRILYKGEESNVNALAPALCSGKTFGQVIKSNICNAGSIPGCPTNRDQFKFMLFASCYGAYLTNKTVELQLEYYETGADVACMVSRNACKDFAGNGWATCPLIIHDIFSFIDESGEKYTCSSVYPSAPQRCEERFEDAFLRYCPLPTELEKNMPFIVSGGVVGGCVLCVMVVMLYRHQKRTYLHYISRKQVMSDAVNSFESFSKPLNNVHPELAVVLAESKFKNVVFDKHTQKWGVLGEVQKYDNEKEAAQNAYLRMAETRAGGEDEESARYVVSADPLTQEQVTDLRLQQLVAFYEFWEPGRQDVEDHARALLAKHDFQHLVRALKTKWGVCPPSWDAFDQV